VLSPQTLTLVHSLDHLPASATTKANSTTKDRLGKTDVSTTVLVRMETPASMNVMKDVQPTTSSLTAVHSRNNPASAALHQCVMGTPLEEHPAL